jgi:hypothetical protein
MDSVDSLKKQLEELESIHSKTDVIPTREALLLKIWEKYKIDIKKEFLELLEKQCEEHQFYLTTFPKEKGETFCVRCGLKNTCWNCYVNAKSSEKCDKYYSESLYVEYKTETCEHCGLTNSYAVYKHPNSN